MNASVEFLVLDLGNSALKIGVCGDGVLLRTVHLPLDRAATWLDAAGHHAAGGIWVSTSNPAAWSALRPSLMMAGLPIWVAGIDVQVPLTLDYEPEVSLGVDRKLAAFAAWREAKRSVGVVSGGTALTWDWVDVSGVFRGGAIAPGLSLVSRALATAAPHLPAAEARDTQMTYPGRSSRACVSLGQRAFEEGLVKTLLADFDAVTGGNLPLYVAGGDHTAVARHLPSSRVRVCPDLVLHGLVALALTPR